VKSFCFTVDDNIRFLKELSEGSYHSIFEHPYPGMYRQMHEKYGLKVQLNLFYECKDFNLTQMTDRYRDEFIANADWLKLSFHSKKENHTPYRESGYQEVFDDCHNVHREVVRFASESALAKTTTIHCTRTTSDGLRALKDNGVRGLLGLYGNDLSPRDSYQNTPKECEALRHGEVVLSDNMAYAGIDIILNRYTKEDIISQLHELADRDLIKVMIHEQYFYPDYIRYQSNFEEKLAGTFDLLAEYGYRSIFFEEKL